MLKTFKGGEKVTGGFYFNRTDWTMRVAPREGEVLPSPGPDVVLHPGDLLVAVGTQEGLDTAAGILRNG